MVDDRSGDCEFRGMFSCWGHEFSISWKSICVVSMAMTCWPESGLPLVIANGESMVIRSSIDVCKVGCAIGSEVWCLICPYSSLVAADDPSSETPGDVGAILLDPGDGTSDVL